MESEAIYTFEWMPPKPPSEAIIEAISSVTGEDPLEMRPLYTYIDPEALDDLFRQSGSDATVSLHYDGYKVVVDESGQGRVFEDDD